MSGVSDNFKKAMQPALEAVEQTNELLKELKSLVKEGNKTGLKELGQRIKSESTSAANDINAGAQELNNSAKTNERGGRRSKVKVWGNSFLFKNMTMQS